MGGQAELKGPDFARGVPASNFGEGDFVVGHVGDEAVLLGRTGGELVAVSATCTHYGGPLGAGLVADGAVRCPWHHACFDLKTGESIEGPALTSLACFDVVRDGDFVKVGKKKLPLVRVAPAGPSSVLVVGAGPAGTACAETLRREGYAGPITMVGAELPGPVDRPNLSKDYLAGTAPEEWIPLRTADALRDERVELVADDAVARIDATARTATLKSGRVIAWGALVFATGAEPILPPIDGADLPHVHRLRTLGDSRAIVAAVAKAKRAVVIGASFIGLEAAASLKKRGLDVTVVGPESTPLARILGDEVGRFVRAVHEENGVAFALGVKPLRITPSEVALSDGRALPADVVVMGVGVRPRTKLAEETGLRVDNGVVVDASFRAVAPRRVRGGRRRALPVRRRARSHRALRRRDPARAIRGARARGAREEDADVPFFWSQHHDVTLNYVGHASSFDAPEVHGDLGKRDAIVAYRKDGRVKAVLTVGAIARASTRGGRWRSATRRGSNRSSARVVHPGDRRASRGSVKPCNTMKLSLVAAATALASFVFVVGCSASDDSSAPASDAGSDATAPEGSAPGARDGGSDGTTSLDGSADDGSEAGDGAAVDAPPDDDADDGGTCDGGPTSFGAGACDGNSAARWATMVSAPIALNPTRAAGLSLGGAIADGGADGGAPLSVEDATSLNCQLDEAYGDCSTWTGFWGANEEVLATVDLATDDVFYLGLQLGYAGTLDFQGASHTYKIEVGNQIQRDGAPITLDWSNTTTLDATADEIYRALMGSFAPSFALESRSVRHERRVRGQRLFGQERLRLLQATRLRVPSAEHGRRAADAERRLLHRPLSAGASSLTPPPAVNPASPCR